MAKLFETVNFDSLQLVNRIVIAQCANIRQQMMVK